MMMINTNLSICIKVIVIYGFVKLKSVTVFYASLHLEIFREKTMIKKEHWALRDKLQKRPLVKFGLPYGWTEDKECSKSFQRL